MEDKQARLTVLIDPRNKAAFEIVCSLRDSNASEVLRQLIAEYLARHGVDFPGEPDTGTPVVG